MPVDPLLDLTIIGSSRWEVRVPAADDLMTLISLRRADRMPWTDSDRIDTDGIESEVVGPASWTRRQLLAVDAQGHIGGWVVVHDRAAGLAMVAVYVDRGLSTQDQDAIAAGLYQWAQAVAIEIAQVRGITQTRLEASPFEGDVSQREWLAKAGYMQRRRWLHMSRLVQPGEMVPPLREGVQIRRVMSHENGLPIAADLQLVHQMLEKSFEDHFNSYRESFPEFVQRLREDPGHRWDHWWLAFVDIDGTSLPAGAVVSTVTGDNESSYVDYIGVNRNARGRGVAKGLLFTVIADAAERGRVSVGLEVDADSPTNADQLYRSLGWATKYVTQSWLDDLEVPAVDG